MVVKQEPQDGAVLRTIARTYFEVHHYPKALKQYLAAEKFLPQDKDIPFKIATCYQQMSNFRDAMTYFEKALALDADNPAKIFEAANSCYDASNYPRAIELYQLADAKGFLRVKYLRQLGPDLF
ncbi:MAG: tetratricopeptide repeat protein [Bacteroidota bacterium]|nr:MAG: tetratricopeptide repeat protein [Bacteroidota bacterium]